jgi:hypothetical protein
MLVYYESKYPDNKIIMFEKNKNFRIFNAIQWIFILLFWGIICSYITFVFIWMLLGAVIDPSKYLVLATSALSFVILIRRKYIGAGNLANNY